MIRYSILGSGSDGNSYLFEGRESALLVDNGFSLKEMRFRAQQLGHDLAKLKLILLTHTHTDHCRGVGAAGRKFKVPVALHRDTPAEALLLHHQPQLLRLTPGKVYACGEFSYEPFALSHDAPTPLGYRITFFGISFLILTDTGKLTDEMASLAAASDVLFLESNYDEHMLDTGPYPLYLKRRIRSETGHLSNRAAAEFLSSIDAPGEIKRRVYLCHLSGTNNHPEQAAEAVSHLSSEQYAITVCKKGSSHTGILENASF